MEGAKRAHLMRAKEKYDDESTDTPGSFEEFFSGQYVDEYGAESKKSPSRDVNKEVVDRYVGYLASTRANDDGGMPGLLGKVQSAEKMPFPENNKEDELLVAKILEAVHSEVIQNDIRKYLQSSPKNTVQAVSETAANVALKTATEIQKQREITDEAESAVLTIALEELWTMAANMGMKKVPPEVVDNSLTVAAGIYNKMDEGLNNQEQPQQVMGGGMA